MSVAFHAATNGAGTGAAQAVFLEHLPVIIAVARRHFSHVACPDRREDGVCEAVALAWAWFVRLRARGRDPGPFSGTFARLAARAAASGRRLCGQEPARDVLSPACRRARGFAVRALAGTPAPAEGELADALRDNTRSPVADQVQFRADFPAWLRTLTERNRRVLRYLALGHRTKETARAFRVTSARISQLRAEFQTGYLAFLSSGPGRAQPVPIRRVDHE